MCGIVGKLNFDGKGVSNELIQNMTNSISYRGPDDYGIWNDNYIALGHRRLSIIDLSKDAHQPMVSDDGNLIIVYNGEIYNFKDLRYRLINKGYTFRSSSDTEVLLYLYKEYGKDCLSYLRGMFAFAIWDSKNKTLFLARDRFGKKPLKYYIDDKSIIFASELKAILKDTQVKKEVDYNSINHYLTFHYMPSPYTGFRGIYKLPHSHYLIVKKGKLSIHKYWDIDYSKKTILSSCDLKHEIINRLKESVNLRMISDVPLGAFLSGGIDSSIVVALMSQISTNPVKTFSIGFEEADYSELSYAKMIAKRYNTDHHEFIVKADMSILPKLVWHYEEPYGDPSALPTYYLAKMTRDYVTVALNGDGGDENFAGYKRYQWIKTAYYLMKLPITIRKTIVYGLKAIQLGYNNNILKRISELINNIDNSLIRNYFNTILYISDNQKNKAYTRYFKELLKGDNSFNIFTNLLNDNSFTDPLDLPLYIDFRTYVPDDLMVKVDISSMAHSLESRSPLLDHLFVEFAAGIRMKNKLTVFETKSIFKKALKDYLPSDILYRKKMGFGIPIDKWFRTELKGFLMDNILKDNSFVLDILKKDYINSIINDHLDNKRDNSYILWGLLTLELWHDIYFN